jgi:sugar phosphate isomerase/epimerase
MISSAPVEAPRRRLSISQWALPDTSFEEDVALASGVGLYGLHVAERKVPPGFEQRLFRSLRESGLAFSGIISETVTILRAHAEFGGRDDPQDRIDDLCAAVNRLGPYGPDTFLVITGHDPSRPQRTVRDIVIGGLRQLCATASLHGVVVVVEPMRDVLAVKTSFLRTLPDALDLIDEVGADNLKVCFDIFHLWDTPDVFALARRFAGQVGSVHVSDRRRLLRLSRDRLFPGDGIVDLAGMVTALEEGGYRVWYHLFVASDKSLEDSLWRLPPTEFVARCTRGFEAVLKQIGNLSIHPNHSQS